MASSEAIVFFDVGDRILSEAVGDPRDRCLAGALERPAELRR